MKYRTLHRWHIWLGWLVGLPLIVWTASGLLMVAKPIEEVRGTHLRAKPLAVQPIAPTAPLLEGRAVEKLGLEQRRSGPVWIIEYMDGGMRRADPATGALLPKVSANEAMTLADSYYIGSAKAVSARRFAADKPPLDLRRARPSWRISYDDNTRLYIDADSGSLLAVRTSWWRAFDFMWGLHIMDPQTREDTHHPLLIGFAAITLLALLMAFWMLVARQLRSRKTVGRER